MTMTGAEEGWSLACEESELPLNGLREITLASGTLILLVHSKSGIFACCADCPHQDNPLVEGFVDGDVLTCPVHLWQWDMRTGEPLGIAEMPLPKFEVRREGGRIFVRDSGSSAS